MSDNLPEPVAQQLPERSIEMPVAEFEGEYVRTFKGKFPGLNLEMDRGYARGTHLKVQMELRVRNVSVNEERNGDLTREHQFALEQVELLAAYSAEQADPGVGGSASAGYVPPWVAPFVDWVENGATLDFEGMEIPETLQELLETALVNGFLPASNERPDDDVVDAEVIEDDDPRRDLEGIDVGF